MEEILFEKSKKNVRGANLHKELSTKLQKAQTKAYSIENDTDMLYLIQKIFDGIDGFMVELSFGMGVHNGNLFIAKGEDIVWIHSPGTWSGSKVGDPYPLSIYSSDDKFAAKVIETIENNYEKQKKEEK